MLGTMQQVIRQVHEAVGAAQGAGEGRIATGRSIDKSIPERIGLDAAVANVLLGEGLLAGIAWHLVSLRLRRR